MQSEVVCSVCNHPRRAQIERYILNMCDRGEDVDLAVVADRWGLNLDDLKNHIILHSSLGLSSLGSKLPKHQTLAQKIGVREADILLEVANEYMLTLRALGNELSDRIADKDEPIFRTLTKPVTDMYLGLGSEVRATIKTVGELNAMVNGPADNGASGLEAIASAIRQSQLPAGPMYK